MSKRSGIFASVWLALWTIGTFVALTQYWLLPEDAPLAQVALTLVLLLLCGVAWLLTLRRLITGGSRHDNR